MKTVLLSTAYLPSISLFSALLNADRIVIEKHEHYVKQTYRSRCLVYGANGLLPLVVPVVHDELNSKPIHEVRISYHEPWQKIHWRTLESSYRNSPYFEFFEHDLKSFYEKPVEFLFDFNLKLTAWLFSAFGKELNINFTWEYQERHDGAIDLRNSYNPGNRRTGLSEYRQVFAERHGFLSDLSVVDLLFNTGKDTMLYCKKVNELQF